MQNLAMTFILKAQNVFYNGYNGTIKCDYQKKGFKFGTAQRHSLIFKLTTIYFYYVSFD